MLREQGQQLDRVAVERPPVVDGEHAQQLLADDQRKARESLDAFLGHPGIETNLAMVGRVVGHDRNPQFGDLADLAHPTLDPSRNRGRLGGVWWLARRQRAPSLGSSSQTCAAANPRLPVRAVATTSNNSGSKSFWFIWSIDWLRGSG